eukprot:gene105-biopygen171
MCHDGGVGPVTIYFALPCAAHLSTFLLTYKQFVDPWLVRRRIMSTPRFPHFFLRTCIARCLAMYIRGESRALRAPQADPQLVPDLPAAAAGPSPGDVPAKACMLSNKANATSLSRLLSFIVYAGNAPPHLQFISTSLTSFWLRPNKIQNAASNLE